MKKKGIILPIFSLPSKYGIGDFGNEAREFIDILSDNDVNYWKILPINACNKHPYAPISYYALNEDYISIEKLKEKGLVDNTNFDNKEKYYLEAYNNFNKTDEFENFAKNKEIQQYTEYVSKITGKEKEYFIFLQFVLLKQWMELKEYAHSKNVEIIGDMPIYPAFESAETAYNQQYYQTEDGEFKFESGTPPDMYSATGQKWNTPVYNIEEIKKDQYEYFINRYKYYVQLFDKVRIDHFRGYDSFYKIPINEPGTQGLYEDGLGYDFFNYLFNNEEIKPNQFIVEDLGDIRLETVQLRDYYGFMGQKIIQTSLDLDKIEDTYTSNENLMVVPGNHDTHTIRSWYESLSNDKKDNLKEFLKINNCSDTDTILGIIQYCFKSNSRIVAITVQDILGLDDSARINVPGTESENNWTWKLENFDDFKEKIKVLKPF